MTSDGIERWHGQVAMVTGASSGIGEAVARDLAQAGLRVALVARREDRLRALAAGIEAAGGQALVCPADLRDEAQLLAAFARVREAWGGVRVLVNNAGLGRRAALVDGATEDWRQMLEVNVLALLVATREGVQDMLQSGAEGHVIHVGSMSGHRTTGPGSGVYSATKFAVRALTESLRVELRALDAPIRVSAVSPGFVRTEFAEKFAHGDAAGAEATYSQFPVLESADVAAAVRYALAAPPHVQVHDVLMRPTQQPT